ncbi:MAG: hypothetical protein R3E96_12910 [Planctomycetota bacterium]
MPRAALLLAIAVSGLGLAGCSLLPVTKAAAMPPPERPAPGPGERVRRNSQGVVTAVEPYLIDEQGRVWRHGVERTFWSDGKPARSMDSIMTNRWGGGAVGGKTAGCVPSTS